MSAAAGPSWPRNRRGRPVVVVDRCLGHDIVDSLRRFQVNAFHLGDIYGNDGAHVPDVVWLQDCGQRGYVILTLDDRVRRNAGEWMVLQSAGAKVFTLTARNPSESTIGLYVGRQLKNVLRRGQMPGPAYWRLQGDHVARLLP